MSRGWAVPGVLALIVPVEATAQSLPSYPSYSLTAQVGGSLQQSKYYSDDAGILTAGTDTREAFRYYILDSTWDRSQLSFEYSCVYVDNFDDAVSSPTYEDGISCPPTGAEKSRAIRAFRIALAGPARSQYRLEYECWAGYFGQDSLTYFGRVSEGQLCGHETGGAPREWISKLRIYLSRK